ncbi:MAG: hypothetical protein L3J91_00460, partial [Thermoplasmata archaeon]|nr:hypothetical protein [Thermoplasmata archaeon]
LPGVRGGQPFDGWRFRPGMTPGPPLSEEEEREDRADRDALDKVDAKLRELRPKRQRLVEDVRRLSDEQRALFDSRAPRLTSLEAIHQQHQARCGPTGGR